MQSAKALSFFACIEIGLCTIVCFSIKYSQDYKVNANGTIISYCGMRACVRVYACVCEQTCNMQYCDYDFSLLLQMALDKPDEIVGRDIETANVQC